MAERNREGGMILQRAAEPGYDGFAAGNTPSFQLDGLPAVCTEERLKNSWPTGTPYMHLTCNCAAGINKPDVRFVIHHSLPKSIEGYHQESGRAGRDNLAASCILYYNYGNYIRVKHLLTQGSAEQTPGRSWNATDANIQLETNLDNPLRMVGYCENVVDCRRSLQLAHFGEKFNPSSCNKTCDNCSKDVTFAEEDMTVVAVQLVYGVKLLS